MSTKYKRIRLQSMKGLNVVQRIKGYGYKVLKDMGTKYKRIIRSTKYKRMWVQRLKGYGYKV